MDCILPVAQVELVFDPEAAAGGRSSDAALFAGKQLEEDASIQDTDAYLIALLDAEGSVGTFVMLAALDDLALLLRLKVTKAKEATLSDQHRHVFASERLEDEAYVHQVGIQGRAPVLVTEQAQGGRAVLLKFEQLLKVVEAQLQQLQQQLHLAREAVPQREAAKGSGVAGRIAHSACGVAPRTSCRAAGRAQR